jgi:hypothetical protein
MTPARARALHPGLDTGIAVSTALDLGDCEGDAARARCRGEIPGCGLLRRPLRVLVAPIGESFPVDAACGSGFSAAALEAHARFDVTTSDSGEWVAPLEPGVYLVGAARARDRCAACGGPGCRVEVQAGRVAVRAIAL